MTDAQPPPPDYKAVEPMFAADDKQDVSVVRVSVAIPGLTVKTKWVKKNLLPSRKKEEDNVTINTAYEDQALTLTVEGKDKGSLQGKAWALRIRQLHHPIEKDKCRHEVKDGRILLFLKKVSAKSWYPELGEGLDAYEEEKDTESKEPPKKPKKKKKKKKRKEEEALKKKEKDDDDEEEGEEEEDDDEEESEEDDDDDSDEDEDEEGDGGGQDNERRESQTASAPMME